MKIAFMSQPWNYVPPIRGGSIAIWTEEVTRRLAGRAEVVVYAAGGLQPSVEERDGIVYRRFGMGLDAWVQRFATRVHRRLHIGPPPYTLGSYYLLYALRVGLDARRRGCDVVHLYNMSQFVPVIRRTHPQARIVLNMRAEWLTQLDRRTIAGRIRHADLIVGCSEYITDLIRRRFPEYADRCRTVPNGVDVDHDADGYPDGAAARSPHPEILFVGRISPEKGLHVLMDALQGVVAAVPDVHLTVVGREEVAPEEFIVGVSDDPLVAGLASFYRGGSYLAHLRRQLDEAGLADHVTFTGYVPHERVADLYRRAHVLVNPSFSESFGRSLVEAMSARTPVVATRVGGMVEIVDGGRAGLLVEPGDARALAGALVDVLTDAGLRGRLAETGYERLLSHYTWDRVADALLREHEELAGTHGDRTVAAGGRRGAA